MYTMDNCAVETHIANCAVEMCGTICVPVYHCRCSHTHMMLKATDKYFEHTYMNGSHWFPTGMF